MRVPHREQLQPPPSASAPTQAELSGSPPSMIPRWTETKAGEGPRGGDEWEGGACEVWNEKILAFSLYRHKEKTTTLSEPNTY